MKTIVIQKKNKEYFEIKLKKKIINCQKIVKGKK